MNKIYRLIWSEITQTWVAVSELTKARGKRASGAVRSGPGRRALAAAVLIGATVADGSGAYAATPAPTQLPAGGQIVAGVGTISQSGASLTVTQSTARLAANWSSFNIGSQASVAFHQPSASSVALNRVLSQDPTQIMGHLSANGRVMLVNPAGIVFGPSAQVNVGGLTASTLNISNQDFMAGNYSFANGGNAGAIDNQGRITTPDGGIVAFIAPVVTNAGSIETPKGSTLLAAGDQVTVDFSGDGLISYQMSAGTVQGLVKNSGSIKADGGLIVMTAKAADALTQAVVNNTGLVQAQTMQDKQGHIVLLSDMHSGTTQVGGTLDASAPNGGDGGTIETSGHTVNVADNAKVTTRAVNGQNGAWLLDPYDFTIGTTSTNGNITASALSAALGSSSVTIKTTSSGTSCTNATCTAGASGNGDIFVNGAVSWSANTKLTLSAYRNIDINQSISATGTGSNSDATTQRLVLAYNQGGGGGTYTVNAPVNLPAGQTFSTNDNGTVTNFTVITTLGSSNSSNDGSLQGIKGGLTGHYALGANIDASSTSGWNSGAGFAPIGPATNNAFTGTFDGLGHTITGLYINRSSSYVGLFGVVYGGIVRNVGLVGGSVTANNNFVGGLVGSNRGTISDAYATGSVSGGAGVGGLVGGNQSGTITDAYATGSVTGGAHVGGLVGTNGKGRITDAYATGSVTGSLADVGGLVGGNQSGTITDAYATGSVSGSVTVTGNVGGLAGNNGGTITDAYATGRVSGTNFVGGLVGSDVGTITDGYWDKTTTGQTTSAGSPSSNGLTTAALSSNLPSGFTTGVWGNGGNRTTPYLLTNASFGTVSGNVILGSDTSATPTYYGVILNMTQLQDINSTGLAGKYVLGTNLTDTVTAGSGFAPIGSSSTSAFTGAFDGLGHTITGLYINRPTSSDVGLFGVVYGGIVRNVGLVGDSVTGGLGIGGLVGWNSNGTITNAYATGGVTGTGSVSGFVSANSDVGGLVGINFGTITAAYATGSVTGGGGGGLVGSNNGGTITNAYATGSVSGGYEDGGLVGINHYGTITNAHATGSVSGGDGYGVGGLVGTAVGGTLTDVYATGNVTGGGFVGGLVGTNASTLTDAYANGSVTCSGTHCASAPTGGLVGWDESATITDAYATGSVTGGSYVGGLAGSNSNGTITDAYATGSVSGTNYLGGLVGINSGTITGSFYDTTTSGATEGINGTADTAGSVWGMTDAQMQNPANFVVATPANGNVNPNWDFKTVWGAEPGVNNGYPTLRALNTTLPTLLVVSVPAKSMTYGSNAPSLVIGSSNYVYGGTNMADVSNIAWGSAVSNTTHAGTYNYPTTSNMFAITYTTTGAEVAFTSNSLTVKPATLTATLTNTNVSKVYDGTTAAPSGFTPSWNITGFVNGDTGATLTSTNALYNSAHVTSTTTLTVSGLAITGVTGGTASLTSDYSLSTSSASVAASITPAPLTITANNATKTYDGKAYSGGNGVSYSGFVNGEGPGVLGGTLIYGGTSQGAVNIGSYSLIPSGYTATNYAIRYVDGILTITPRNSTGAGELLNSTSTSGSNTGGSLSSPSLISTGGQLDPGGRAQPLTLQFSTNAPSTTLTTGAPGSGAPQGSGPAQTDTLLLSTQSGGTLGAFGTVTLSAQRGRLALSPAPGGEAAAPAVNTTVLQFVTAQYRPGQGAPQALQVGVAKDGALVIEVTPHLQAQLGTKQIALLGLTIAKARLGVQPLQVKGVVVNLRCGTPSHPTACMPGHTTPATPPDASP